MVTAWTRPPPPSWSELGNVPWWDSQEWSIRYVQTRSALDSGAARLLDFVHSFCRWQALRHLFPPSAVSQTGPGVVPPSVSRLSCSVELAAPGLGRLETARPRSPGTWLGPRREGTPWCVCGHDLLAASAALGSTGVNYSRAGAIFPRCSLYAGSTCIPPPSLPTRSYPCYPCKPPLRCCGRGCSIVLAWQALPCLGACLFRPSLGAPLVVRPSVVGLGRSTSPRLPVGRLAKPDVWGQARSAADPE